MLLLDRARFPRDKPCGGGVTGRAARLLPFSIDPVVEDVVTIAELRLGYGQAVERGSGRPLVYMTQRRRLDALPRRASGGGRGRVPGRQQGHGHRDERTRRDGPVNGDAIARARTVVGADGVNGVTARALELGGNQAVGVALEGNLSHEHDRPRALPGAPLIELGDVPGGYGWVFPKGDHVNFGVGGWRRKARLREHLAGLCGGMATDIDDLDELPRLPAADARAASCLARAAARSSSATRPASSTRCPGDGMYEGFLSGSLATGAVIDVLAGSGGDPRALRRRGSRASSHRSCGPPGA